MAPIIEELEEGLLLKDADGHVPAAYRLAVEMAAVQLLAVRRGEAFLDVNGEHDEQGNVRPEVEGLAKAAARAEKALDRLGMTPMAATKLYGDLAQLQQQRPVDLATALSEPDPELRRQLLRRVPGWEDDHVN